MALSTGYSVQTEENNMELVGRMVCPSSSAYFTVYNNTIDPIQEKGNYVCFYEMKRPIGFALLLGCSSAPCQSGCLPTKIDLALMENTLKEEDWFIKNPCLNSNYPLTNSQFLAYVDALKCNPTLHKFSCFMFYYSGHGNHNGALLSDGSCMLYEEIVTSIASISCLQKKPKIFIFDCCQGVVFENVRTREKYPPAHTILAFSSCEGMTSYANKHGSYYTRDLSSKLKEFGKKLSFPEILTFVNGGTAMLATHMNCEQRPLMCSTLDRILVLNCDGLDKTAYSGIDSSSMNHSSLVKCADKSYLSCLRDVNWVGLQPGKQFHKGSSPNTSSPEYSDEMVSLDGVTKDPLPNLKFKLRQDVTSNIKKLGQGLSVFICYVPDSKSPYSDTCEPRPTERDLILIQGLVYDLEHHGFTVISDLHLGDTQPHNWLIWYSSRICLCDHLIMVCSPAFKETFSSDRPIHTDDERVTRFFAYRNVLYKAIVDDMVKSSDTSKAIPVILDQWKVEDSVPTLFGMSQTYQLFSEIPREFDYDNRERGFERLICRMAGINRMELDKPFNEEPPRLPKPYATSSSVMGMGSFVGPKPPKGYRMVKSKLVQPDRAGIQQQPPTLVYSHGKPATPFVTQQIVPTPYSGYINRASAIIPASSLVQHPDTTFVKPVTPFPERKPDRQVILWLCDKITNWKFIGRRLGIEESVIEDILYQYPRNVQEQRHAMFEKWKRQVTCKYSYRTLGDVLLDSEDNKMIYPAFCEKVAEVEHRKMQP